MLFYLGNGLVVVGVLLYLDFILLRLLLLLLRLLLFGVRLFSLRLAGSLDFASDRWLLLGINFGAQFQEIRVLCYGLYISVNCAVRGVEQNDFFVLIQVTDKVL